jgi:hypothetical protein
VAGAPQQGSHSIVFGRRRQREVEAEAAREAERRALFAELAKRPDTVCPFLGMAQARTEYQDGVSDEHRCYAFGDPAELSAEQQTKVCLQRGYGNCPRYLRGILVIPTDELEALRRARPEMPPAPVRPAPAPQPAPASSGGGGRRAALALGLVLLLAVGGGLGAFALLNDDNNGIANQTPTPTEQASEDETPGVTSTPEASVEPTAEPTPFVVPTSSQLPTPQPGDQSTGFVVIVDAGEYPVVRIDDQGQLGDSAVATFDRRSGAPVQRFEIDGNVYWRTLQGNYTDLAYSRAFSDAFVIYETYETPDGEPRFRELGEDEL